MELTREQIRAARRALLPPGSVAGEADCLAAVNRLGMAWPFTPGNELLPALFPALATDREGTRWEWMWGWKDRLAAGRAVFYGKVVGGKPTFVSLEWLPLLYALTGLTGDLDDDLAHTAESVRLHELAYKIHRYIREQGPTGTRTLQAKLTDGTREMRQALDKALDQLDAAMLIAKSGTEGGNSIANIWEVFPRQFPEAVDAGTEVATRDAAVRLARQFFGLTPAVARRAASEVFPWNRPHQEKAIARLLEAGELAECQLEGKPALRRADFTGQT